ncbi:hypothetical protein COJ46_15710 [Bacillus sp. AFS077874]|uniref:hypothetical protein n=1 Tax=Bacillus sp. AFS077874 TaxID=2033513 RepID=UPI000BF61F32|nr:hypothetical protein [Bacillus sp. AFS077874]PFM78971.1 hypothetical protein COJ46_15710 [Bacillus sp. AFS077874]
MKSKSKYALNNILAQIVVQFAVFAAGICVPRFIILTYGSEINGISSTVNQLVSYASLLEAGLGMASIQALYAPLNNNNLVKINGILSATKNYYKRISMWFTTVMISLAIIYPFFAKGETDKVTIAALLITISSTAILEFLFHSKYRVLLTADQKLYIISYTRAIALVLQTIIKIILIIQNMNVILVFAVSSLVLLLRIFYIKWYVQKHYKDLDFNGAMDISALSQRSALLVHQIAGLVVNNTDTFILSIFVSNGLKLASVYVVYSMVFKNLYSLIMGAFSNGVVASFGHYLHERNLKEVNKIFRTYELTYLIIQSAIWGTASVMILPFINLYTKGVRDIEYTSVTIATLFICVYVLNSSRIPCVMLINAVGHFQQTKNRAVIEAVINLIMMLLLVNKYHIVGILIAGLLSYAYSVPYIIVYTNKKILEVSSLKSIKRIFQSWLSILLTASCMTFLIKLSINTWSMWLLSGILSFIISTIISFMVFLLLDFTDTKSIIYNFKKKIFRIL